MNTDIIVQKAQDFLTTPLFTLGNTPVTIVSIVVGIIILLLFLFLSRLLKTKFLAKILAKFQIEESIQFTLTKLSQYVVIFIGVVVSFQTVGIDLSGLAVVLGFLSVGIGFGLQNITSNFIAGIILLFERPIKVGDRVTIGDREGDIENITIRSTTIRSLRNISIIVPNSDFISTQVINWSHTDKVIAIDINVGVSYSSDVELVKEILLNVAKENHDVLKNPKSIVLFTEFGDSSLNFILRVWINKPKEHYRIKSDLNFEILKQFRENKIDIPFPQNDVNFKNVLEYRKLD